MRAEVSLDTQGHCLTLFPGRLLSGLVVVVSLSDPDV